MLFDSYKAMDNINVTEEMVNVWEKSILKDFENKKVIYLEMPSSLQNYRFIYTKSSYEEEVKKLNSIISDFMAYQEAIMSLINKGKIIPVNSPNMFYSRNYNIKIYAEENSSNSTTYIDSELLVPILEYKAFMLKPSLMNKSK